MAILRLLAGDKVLSLTMVAAFCASTVSFQYFYQEGLITAFGDAQARLIMARMVIDSINVGPEQLGGVWPPLPQALMVLFIWNDFLFRSGIAGSIISMFSYIVAVFFIYKLVLALTKDKLASFLGVVAFSNPNILFMQATPMSEVPFIAFFAMSVYFLVRWVQDIPHGEKLYFLFLCGAAILCATWTRYEGWVLLMVVSGIVFYTCLKNRFGFHKTVFRLQFFGIVAIAGIIGWLLWNQIIFGDVLFFTRSEFSAGQLAERTMVGLDFAHRTEGNFEFSLKVWSKTSIDNIGFIPSLFALFGLLALLVSRKSFPEKMVGLVLLFPFFFYVGTLYAGFSTIVWHPDYFDGGNWGTRYGTLMLPAAGVLIGFLVGNSRALLKVQILTFVIASSIITWQSGLISVHEAKIYHTFPGTQVQNRMVEWIDQNYDHGLILLFRVGNERVIFNSKIPLSKVVYEGAEPDFWKTSLQDPVENYIDWIIMWNNLNGEPDMVWRSLRNTAQLVASYDLVYLDENVEIYKIKNGYDKKSARF